MPRFLQTSLGREISRRSPGFTQYSPEYPQNWDLPGNRSLSFRIRFPRNASRNSSFLRYYGTVSGDVTVWLFHNNGRHAYQLNGTGLFEVAGWALAHFVSNGYLSPGSMQDAELCLQVDGGAGYRVKAERIRRWLGEESPDHRLRLIKEQIWRAMTKR